MGVMERNFFGACHGMCPFGPSRGANLPIVHLQPSQLMVAQDPTLLVTILGSCVAVCLYDRKRKVGAMCHGLLPKARADIEPGECRRFVDCSIHSMVMKLAEQCGCRPADLEAKLFGGSRMFHTTGQGGAAHLRHVGVENIKSARGVLRQYGMKITVEEVGAEGGYKVYFESHTGRVHCKLLRSPERSSMSAGR